MIASLIVKLIHLIVIILTISVPFLSQKYILLKIMFLFYMPILWFHWYIGNGLCSLTILDNYLNGRHLFEGKGFISKIIEPVYLFPNNKEYILNRIIWIVSILLWIKVIYDVYRYLRINYNLYFLI